MKFNQNAMDEVKEKAEQLKTLATTWLKKAKENQNDGRIVQLGGSHLETLRLLNVVLDKKNKKQFFTDLFEASLGYQKVSIRDVSAYAIYFSFINDRVTLFENLVKMAAKESNKERLNNILDIIKRYEYFSKKLYVS